MSDQSPPDTTRPSARPLAGSISLLLVVAMAVATPAVGMQALLLADLGSGHTTVERAGLRLITGTIAHLVRGASRRATTQHPARPGPTWATRSLCGAPGSSPGPADAVLPPRGHVRVALLDLPPPLV